MFEDKPFDSPSWRPGARKVLAIPLAMAIELALIAALAIVPLLHLSALPRPVWQQDVLPVPPRGPRAASHVSVRRPKAQKLTLTKPIRTPVVIPRLIPQAAEKSPVLDASSPGPNLSELAEVSPGFGPGAAFPGGAAIPSPPQAVESERPTPVGGDVEAARLIYGPEPEYPPLARMARVQGTVRLRAIIARDGTIRDLSVMAGHPMLASAALSAVLHWRYRPTLLDGSPVEVETEIDVKFTLGN